MALPSQGGREFDTPTSTKFRSYCEYMKSSFWEEEDCEVGRSSNFTMLGATVRQVSPANSEKEEKVSADIP